MYVNAQSLVGKMNLLTATVESLELDVVGVTETWAHEGVDDSELSIPGYKMYRVDRLGGQKGGGVILYVKSNIKSVEHYVETDFPEHVWSKLVDCAGRELIIGVCYRTPTESIFGKSIHEKLRKLLAEVSKKHVVLMGDFNYPGIDWGTLQYHSTASEEARLFLNCVEDCFLTQHVNITPVSTRIPGYIGL